MHVPPCHVTHLVYRLGTGGMENVVVQLIRHLPRTSFRHTVIALSDIDPEFARRLDGTDVELIALNKPPGQPYALYPKVYRLLRRLRPDVLHSCNLGALEFVPVAALARVPLRVHVEHGLDLHEINGKSARYRLLRRLYRPFVSQYVAVSVDQARQCAQVGAAAERVHLIPNGVDTRVFRPRTGDDALPVGFPFQRAVTSKKFMPFTDCVLMRSPLESSTVKFSSTIFWELVIRIPSAPCFWFFQLKMVLSCPFPLMVMFFLASKERVLLSSILPSGNSMVVPSSAIMKRVCSIFSRSACA